jgi:hypothetical protein
VISEFVASNDRGLEDGDKDRPDWLELYNSGDEPVDLTGWHLTDDADELTKWTFPQVMLGPHDSLVVYASGKDHTDPTQPLHTNFRLRASGEYLGLVEPDGGRVAFDFGEEYPPQYADVAYGFRQPSRTVTLVSRDTEMHAWIDTTIAPREAWPSEWKQIDFDDSSWIRGVGGVGFDLGSDYADLIGIDVVGAMYEKSASTLVRIPFAVHNPAAIYSLSLRMKYDDGYIAYLNGVEVARQNAPTDVRGDSVASTFHSDRSAKQFEEIDISPFATLLREGNNVLAIHGLNRRIDDNDFLIVPEVIAHEPGEIELDKAYFFAPTSPERPNGTDTYLGKVAPILCDVVHGFYEAPFDLTVTTETPDVQLFYTTDGSLPSSDNGRQLPTGNGGTATSGKLRISGTTTLRVAGYKEGMISSNTETHTYIFVEDVIRQSPDGQAPSGWPESRVGSQRLDYGMDPDVVNNPEFGPLLRDALVDLPSISIVTDLDHLFDRRTGIFVNAINARGNNAEWERPASVELIYPDGSEGFQVDAGLRLRGGYGRSGDNPKHAFRLVFRNDYGEGKLRYPLFGDEGVAEFDNIDLRTAQVPSWTLCHPDAEDIPADCPHNTMVREVFSRDTLRDMGQPYTRSRYYHLYLNGQYWGLFQSEERPEASYAESYFGGDKENYDVVKVESNPWRIEATDGSLDAWRELWQMAKDGFVENESYYRVQGLNVDGSRNEEYRVLVDIDNLIDYMLVIFYTGDLDAPISDFGDNRMPNNWYGIRNRTSDEGFRFFAHDAEWTLMDPQENRLGPWPAGRSFTTSNPQWIHQQLMANADYRRRFADRAHSHLFNGGALTQDAALARIQKRIEEIDLAIVAESARWGDTWRSDPYTKTDWLAAVSHITNTFIPQRTQILVEQLSNAQLDDGTPAPLYPVVAQAPTFSKHGGEVPFGYPLSINAPGDVYFTLDGSDPRRAEPTGPTQYLVEGTSPARFLIPSNASLGRDWTLLSFDDSSWTTGFAAVGFDVNKTTVNGYFATDAESSMYKHGSTIFLRIPILVEDPSTFDKLILRLRYDDGFVAYLNGVEVARRNIPAIAEWDSVAPNTVGGAGAETGEMNLSEHLGLLAAGKNVLAIHGINRRANDRDFLVLPELSSGTMTDTGASISAYRYEGPMSLLENSTIKARAQAGGEWSALTEARFILSGEEGRSEPGDANRDLVFNQLDIVQVLQFAKYLTGEPATWDEGDWNADGVLDQEDIVAALATGNYMQGLFVTLNPYGAGGPFVF